MPKRFAGLQTPTSIVPLFEWPVDEKGFAVVEAGRKDYDAVFNRLHQKCLAWLDSDGHLIIHYSFGFRKVLNDETRHLSPDYLKFTWRANNYTSVFGIVLDGQPVSRNSFLSDFCHALNIDHFYALGLLHGLDGLSGYLVRTELKLNDSYLTGYQHGEELARKYIIIKGGYLANKAWT